jgi:hypothetical protein
MSTLWQRLMHWFKRRPSSRLLEDAQRYRRSLTKASEALPKDPAMQRVIDEYERAEEAMRSAR